MDARRGDLPDTTHLRQRLAPVLRPRLAHILAHAEAVRRWTMQDAHISAAERQALLEHLTALEETARQLSALLETSTTPLRDP